MILYRLLQAACCMALLLANPAVAQNDVASASKQERLAALERILPAKRTVQQHLALSRAYYQAGRLDDALKEASAVLKRHPDVAEAWLIRGDIWRERGQWTNALAAFDRAAKINPNQPEIELRRGQALMALGRTREADLAFERYGAQRQVQRIRTTDK